MQSWLLDLVASERDTRDDRCPKRPFLDDVHIVFSHFAPTLHVYIQHPLRTRTYQVFRSSESGKGFNNNILKYPLIQCGRHTCEVSINTPLVARMRSYVGSPSLRSFLGATLSLLSSPAICRRLTRPPLASTRRLHSGETSWRWEDAWTALT